MRLFWTKAAVLALLLTGTISASGQSLGLVVRDINGQIVVTSVTRSSPAAKAGLKDGDIIVGVNGDAVVATAAFVDILKTNPGERVAIDVLRAGTDKSLRLKVPDGFGGAKKAPTRRTAKTQTLDAIDSWTGAMHCAGNDYVVNATLKVDGTSVTGRVRGIPTLPAHETLRPPARGQAIDADFRGTLDRYTGQFELSAQSRDRVLPQIKGVLVSTSNDIVAEVAGNFWRECSSLILLAGGSENDARGLLTKSMAARQYRPGRPKKCRKETQRWLQDLNDLSADLTTTARRTPAHMRSRISALYSEPRFSALFGASFRELSEKKAHKLYAELTSSSECMGVLDAQSQPLVRQLAQPLINDPRFGRGHVLVNVAARARYTEWLDDLHTSRDRSSAQYSPQAAQLAISQLEQRRQEVAALMGVSPTVAVSPVIGNIARSALDDALFTLIDQTAATLPALDGLAQWPGRQQALFSRLVPKDRDAFDARIDGALASQLNSAVKTYADAQRGDTGLVALSNWQSAYPTLSRRLTESQRGRVTAGLAANKAQVAQTLVSATASDYQRAMTSASTVRAKMAASIAFEEALAKRPDAVRSLPAMATLKAARKTDYLGWLAQERSALIQSVQSASSSVAARDIQKRYVMVSLNDNPDARAIAQAVDSRVGQLSPFLSLRGGEYLDAIYNNDMATQRQFDAKFTEPYRNGMFMEGMNSMAPLMDGIASLAGFDTDYGEYMRQSLDAASLLLPVLAIYLLDYEQVYKRCLRSDAVVFKKTVTSETVYKDGWGNEQYSIQHPDSVSYFTVNREFAQAFDAVGLNNPDSPLANMFDSMMRSKGELSVPDLINGTRTMMRTYACDDPKIERMEDQMLRFFAEHKKRTDQAGRALLKQR